MYSIEVRRPSSRGILTEDGEIENSGQVSPTPTG